MKHTWIATTALVVLFFCSQLFGIAVLKQYIDVDASKGSGLTVFRPLMLAGSEVERPDLDPTYSFGVLFGAVLVGTILALILVRLEWWFLWKVWFFVAVWATMSLSLGAFFNSFIAVGVGLVLSVLKSFRKSVILHNLTEFMVYAGIAVIFVPVMNLFAGFSLLVLISLYDAWAVWKNKHMITLAKAQSKSKAFAGFIVPYTTSKDKQSLSKFASSTSKPSLSGGKKSIPASIKSAILGGGDVGFCLLFAGVVLKETGSVWSAVIVAVFASVALMLLLMGGKKNRFYPAMPFLSAGCFLGFLVAHLLI